MTKRFAEGEINAAYRQKYADLLAFKLRNQQKEKHYFTDKIAIYNNPFSQKNQFFRILLHKVCIYFDLSRIICSRHKERMGIKAHFFCTWNSHKKTTCRFTKNNGSFYQKQRLVFPQTTCCLSANKVLIRQPTGYQNKKSRTS